jgi:hypothetical protein
VGRFGSNVSQTPVVSGLRGSAVLRKRRLGGEYQMSEAMSSQFVIAGLDTAGWDYPTCGTKQCETRASPGFDAINRTEEEAIFSMDARVKPAHDES